MVFIPGGRLPEQQLRPYGSSSELTLGDVVDPLTSAEFHGLPLLARDTELTASDVRFEIQRKNCSTLDVSRIQATTFDVWNSDSQKTI